MCGVLEDCLDTVEIELWRETKGMNGLQRVITAERISRCNLPSNICM